ncbi:MAG: VOC family protein [Acidobacteriota bacterium]|jgi:methylmalonyl-CoA/ethylmalonyl-CoA epimerase
MTTTPSSDSSSGLHLARIGQIAVTVEDIDRATAFYRDTLGVPHLFSAPGMAFFDCSGVRLMLSLPEGSDPGAASILYFRSDDVQRDAAILKDRGVRLEGEPHAVHKTDTSELWMAFFRDSEGNPMALMQER